MNRSRLATVNKRALAYSAVTAGVLYATLVIAVFADRLVESRYPEYSQPFTSWLPDSMAASLAIMTVFGVLLAIGFYTLFTRFGHIREKFEEVGPLAALSLRFRRKDIVIAGIALFVCWLPITIIMYPTGLTADTFNQLYQFQTASPTYYPTTGALVDAEFIDHHPVFDTLLYGMFWQIGDALGSQNNGIFALSVLQSAVLGFELGLLVCYLERIGVPYVLRVLALVFFAWFPLFGHYACTVLKDSTYLTVFVPWMVMWIEIARTRGEALEDKRFFTTFMLLGGLCVITKKLGVFVLAPCLALVVVVARRWRTRAAIGSLATLIVFCAVLPAAVYPAIGGVAPGGKQEILGPAIQHVTALLVEDANALDDTELSDVNKVFNVKKAMKNFELFRSDAAKSTFHADATDDEIMRFMQIWAAQGLKHPLTYLTATAGTSGMLYVPFMKLTYYTGEDLQGRAENYAQMNSDFSIDVAQPDDLIALNDYLEFDSLESKVSDLPIISLFFTGGFYGSWVLIMVAAMVLFARKPGRYEVVAIAPLIVTALLLAASPVASPRYVLPLLFTTPLAFGWAWHCLDKAD